jgi:hypothetical protein
VAAALRGQIAVALALVGATVLVLVLAWAAPKSPLPRSRPDEAYLITLRRWWRARRVG